MNTRVSRTPRIDVWYLAELVVSIFNCHKFLIIFRLVINPFQVVAYYIFCAILVNLCIGILYGPVRCQ